jgi:predicted DNA-binding transcriptional regulator AlpA
MEKAVLLSNEQAADYLGLSKQTLRIWRHMGKGPRYLKLGGAVKYREIDLIKYIEENVVDPAGERN